MSEENNENTQNAEVGEDFALELLAPSIGARRPRRRIGRGEASGQGKTCGRGHKGQKSRSGASIPAYFEGGQMPLYRRLPKIGFRSRQQYLGRNRYVTVPVSFLEQFDNGTTVTHELLQSMGIVNGPKRRAGIKVLGDGELTKKLTVELATTGSAKAKIEAAGGTVSTPAKITGAPRTSSTQAEATE